MTPFPWWWIQGALVKGGQLVKDVEEIRAETTRILALSGIPCYPHLPLIDISRVRSDREAAERLVVLYTLVVLSEGVEAAGILEWLESEGISKVLTASERSFLSGRTLTEIDGNVLSWKQESLFVLSWAGRIANELGLPWGECDLSAVIPKIPRAVSVSTFFESYRLRDHTEIRQALDVYYCIHHALRHKELWDDMRCFAKLHHVVAVERRIALEWLLNSTLEWDDISLDT